MVPMTRADPSTVVARASLMARTISVILAGAWPPPPPPLPPIAVVRISAVSVEAAAPAKARP